MDSFTNYAIRTTVIKQAAEYQGKYLVIRGSKGGDDGYTLALSTSFLFAGQKIEGSNVYDHLWKASPPQFRMPSVGEEYRLEFGCVGSKLISRFGKEFIKVINDNKWNRGSGYISGGEPIRDIEVINLDGLPEAEALRLLGVDEKGNDLRALAAKQEQQMAEQAKAADAMVAIPELKALHDQFVKLQAERVTAPFEAEVAKLNAGYVGGIDREIANEKKAEHLDGVIALEAEKKLIHGSGVSSSSASDGTWQVPLPEDDEKTTDALKKLRGIYREAWTKLEAARATNLKTLTDPLDARLRQIEAALTKQDRIDHAKTVREYREALSSVPVAPEVPSATPAATSTANTTLSTAKYPKGDDRKAAEWVLEMGGTVMIRESGKETTVAKLDSLPKGRFEIVEVTFARGTAKAASVDSLDALAGLDALESLTFSELPLTDDDFAILPSLPALQRFKIEYIKVTDAITSHLAACNNLQRLIIVYATTFEGSRLGDLSRLKMDFLDVGGSGVTSAGFAALAGWKQLREFQAKNTTLDDAALATLLKGTDLEVLLINRTQVTLAGLQPLKSQRKLRHLGWNVTPGSATREMSEVASLCPGLSTLELDTQDYSADDIASASAFRNLTNLFIGNRFTRATTEGVLKLNIPTVNIRSVGDLTDDTLAVLAGHRSLRTIMISTSPNVTDAVLDRFTSMKSLTKLSVTACPKITAAGVAAFKKKRPEVTVTR